MVIRQCDDRDDVTCAQILYRTMVFVGPASKDDYLKMMDILTKPRVVELNKLYDAMTQFRFTRNRLKRYGYREPEPSQLFETLRTASSALSEKDSDLHFRFQHYMMKHSSVNGLVNEQIVQEMYDMIVENSRRFLDTPSSMDAKAVQAKGRYRNTGTTDYGCYGCGSSDHWIRIVRGSKPKTHRSKELGFVRI